MAKCLKSTDKSKRRDFFSINELLQPLHLALNFENKRSAEPTRLGVTVSSTEQIYDKWKAFVDYCKNSNTSALPPLFFVSLDISRCFDTLPQEQILKLIPGCLKEESYVIKRFVKIKMGHKNGMRKKYVSMATEGTDCSNFVTFICNGLRNGTILAKNTVFVDKVFYKEETRENLLQLLKKHVTCSVGHIGDKYLHQLTG